MNHKPYDEWLQLYIYDELSGKNLAELQRHLCDCSHCREELEALRQFKSTFEGSEIVQADDSMLNDARRDLMRTIRNEKRKQSIIVSIINWLGEFVIPRYKVALGGATLVAAGVVIGYLFPKTTEVMPVKEPAITVTNAAFTQPVNEELSVSNLQFITSDRSTGEVEFTFDAVMPVHMKGRVDDPKIQKVLAHAIVSDQNPGVRLQSVNALAVESTRKLPDPQVLDALVSAVKSDKNPGVRKEALEILAQYVSDQTVRKALVDVLLHDQSSGLRIAAINALTQGDAKTIRNDTSFLDILRSKSTTDNNNYIRLRSQAVLKEIKQ